MTGKLLKIEAEFIIFEIETHKIYMAGVRPAISLSKGLFSANLSGKENETEFLRGKKYNVVLEFIGIEESQALEAERGYEFNVHAGALIIGKGVVLNRL